MISLLYLSRSLLPRQTAEQQLQEILSAAVVRNLASGVTGALIHTGSDFAQLLEGSEAAVSEIMGSIIIDPRHTNVRILWWQNIEERSFPNWGMVLAEQQLETQRLIDWLSASDAEATAAEAVHSLVDHMRLGASAQV